MNDITIVIPIHIFDDQLKEYLDKAVDSVAKNQENYDSNLKIMMVTGKSAIDSLKKHVKDKGIDCEIKENLNETDFCSQVNEAARSVDTEFFSILEIDDTYTPIWFNSAKEYYYTHEDVSVFLPINVQSDETLKKWEFANEIAWTTSFSNNLGFIDFDCLDNYSSFNLTGGIFNTSDFNMIGGLKPSIKLAFNYEFLLRLTNKGLKVFVVPKEGYTHIINRPGSLTEHYIKSIPEKETHKWFELAKREYLYIEDRKKTIIKDNENELA